MAFAYDTILSPYCNCRRDRKSAPHRRLFAPSDANRASPIMHAYHIFVHPLWWLAVICGRRPDTDVWTIIVTVGGYYIVVVDGDGGCCFDCNCLFVNCLMHYRRSCERWGIVKEALQLELQGPFWDVKRQPPEHSRRDRLPPNVVPPSATICKFIFNNNGFIFITNTYSMSKWGGRTHVLRFSNLMGLILIFVY